MGDEQRNNFSDKQKSYVQRNLFLQKANQRLSVSLQTEKNLYERRMDLAAKNLKKKLTLLIPTNKPSINSAKGENGCKILKLPEIGNGISSAPSSPTLKRVSSDIWGGRFNIPRLSQTSLSPTPNNLPIRRGSCTDVDMFKSSPLLARRAASRTSSLPKEQRVSSVGVAQEDRRSRVAQGFNDASGAKKSKLTNAGSSKKWNDTIPPSPSLGKQFEALGSCRYLRRSIGEDDDAVIKVNGET